MADYSKFDPALASWLQKVWRKKEDVRNEVMKWILDPEDEENVEKFPAYGRKDGAQKIYDMYNTNKRETVEDKNFEDFLKRLKALQEKYRGSIQYEPTVENENECKKDDFFVFLQKPLQGGTRRIYLRFTDPLMGWEGVASHCLHNMVTIKSIVEFKVAGPGLSKKRGDQMVIYLKDDKSVDETLHFLTTDPSMSGRFAGNVPSGVKQLAPGLGYSVQPTSEHDSPEIVKAWNKEEYGVGGLSFGEYLAGVIYLALEQSWRKDEEEYVTQLLKFFDALQIDPKRPHLLRNISGKEYQMLVQNAQGKIVSHGLTPQPMDAPMIDRCEPLPTLSGFDHL